MALDVDTFTLEAANIRWRFHRTTRLGQFDIAIPANDDLAPDDGALVHLEAALTEIDALYDAALIAAEAGWQARYNAPSRGVSAWSLVRVFAATDGSLILTLHEGEFDTYSVWDVTLIDNQPISTRQRPYSAS